jgi:molybdopterin-containing oxidoreductase family membrane subunit
MEHFVAWYSGNEYEQHVFFVNRARGPFSGVYWLMLFCDCAISVMRG